MPNNKQRISNHIDKEMDKILRRATLQAWTSLVKYTPVDTGRARAGWFVSKRVPSKKVPRVPAEGQKIPPSPTPSVVRRRSTADIWYVVNNVEYIDVLDKGRGVRDGQMRGSKQAPNGMTALAMMELKRDIGELF